MKRLGLIFGLVIILFAAMIALLAPWMTKEGISSFSLSSRLAGPQMGHLFGFDEEGRDLFSLVIWGTRISLGISVLTVLLSGFIGTSLGLVAGYFGGKWDQVFVSVTDLFMAFPSILLIIAVAAFYREVGFGSVVLILSLFGWVGYARIVRGQVLALKEREFVLAATGLGASFFRIATKHLVPNLLAPLLVHGTFSMAGVILAESTLSFLGLGLPADVPSWGRLLDQGVQYLLVAPHLSLFPGLAIALLILGFNFLGDGLRDYWDVK